MKNLINIPNSLSILRIFLSIILSILLFNQYNANLILIYLIIILTDILDGHIARKTNKTTNFGAKLDITADMLLVVLTYIPLLIKNEIPLWFLFVILLVISEFVLIQKNNKKVEYDFIGKYFGIGCMALPLIIIILNLLNIEYITSIFLILLTLMGIISVIDKLKKFIC